MVSSLKIHNNQYKLKSERSTWSEYWNDTEQLGNVQKTVDSETK
jgi:hypothetical protein